jgi:hypothetical protein
MSDEQNLEPNPNPNPSPDPAPQPNPNPTPDTKGEPTNVEPKDPVDPENKGEKQDDSKPGDTEEVTFETIPELPENFDPEDPLAGEFLSLLNDMPEDRNEMASRLIGLYAKGQEQMLQQWVDTNAGWQEELKKDPIFGGDKLEPALGKAAAQIDAFSQDIAQRELSPSASDADKAAKAKEIGEGVRAALTLTGAGNNPHTAKLFMWMADQLSEGSPLTGMPGGADLSQADKLFGT